MVAAAFSVKRSEIKMPGSSHSSRLLTENKDHAQCLPVLPEKHKRIFMKRKHSLNTSLIRVQNAEYQRANPLTAASFLHKHPYRI